jgi:hypothetical protein
VLAGSHGPLRVGRAVARYGVTAVVQPGLGGRAVSLLRAPRPTALTLELERPG